MLDKCAVWNHKFFKAKEGQNNFIAFDLQLHYNEDSRLINIIYEYLMNYIGSKLENNSIKIGINYDNKPKARTNKSQK